MNYISTLFLVIFSSFNVFAQEVYQGEVGVIENKYGNLGGKQGLFEINLNSEVSTHFISSEPVQYVDISTNKVVGDIPVPNVLRIKPTQDFGDGEDLGIVTIVFQKYMVQYQLTHAPSNMALSYLRVTSQDGMGLINPEVSMSTDEMKQFALNILKRKGSFNIVRSQAYKVEIKLNNVYTIGDYFFIDLSVSNKSNIKYDIDQMRFKIEDKKIVRATNFQQTEVMPVYQLYDQGFFKSNYRNILVFPKFTFPNEKVFTVEISEKQISGRTVTLKIDYSDILNADLL